jgi:ATP-binding cassette subfamily B protein/subfamily B ATP-binding cassette protein MsbA
LSGLNQTLTYIFQILFFSGALFWLDWRLALAAFIAAPGFMLLARFFSRRIKTASRELRRRSGSITSVAEESLHNIALVQAYHQESTQSRRFRAENLGSFTAQMLATKLEALFAPFTDLMQMVGVLLVVGLGIRELVAGRITLGGLLVFLGYLSQLYGPISGFGHLVNSIYAASAGADRIFELLDTRPEALDPARPKRLDRVHGALRVERLGFRYPDTDQPTLHGVSFSVGPGETVAVVGASGAGKSTLLRLLLRLHQQTHGTVLLDGVDTRELTIAQLRSSIAVVLQETLVFDGTIEENIRWGRPDASDAEVVDAAGVADAHSFISGLPNGYQTRIGQRGMMLSGGQRQRIALARAIIRDAPVLLLDEPTTGLDAASAARVLEPLRRAMNGRTTVVISHNLLTVCDVDRIVYLEEGRVGGYGTHTELMARCAGYAELYRLHHPDQLAVPPIPRRPEHRPGPRPRPSPHARPSPRPRPTPHPRPRPGRNGPPTPMPAVPAPLSVLPRLPQLPTLPTQPMRAMRPDRSPDGAPVAIPMPRRQVRPVGTPATRSVAAAPQPVQRAAPDPLPGGVEPVHWEDDE